MGLFDKIKKSLFGEQEDTEKENVEKTEAEGAVSEKETEPPVQTDKNDQNSQADAEAPISQKGWSDDGSLMEQQREQREATSEQNSVEAEDETEEKTENNWSDSGSLFEAQRQEREDKAAQQQAASAEQAIEAETADEEIASDETASEDIEQERYDKGLEKTNHSFGAKLNAFFAKFRSVDEDFFDELEDLLIESDVGFETAEQLTDSLREEAKLKNAKDHDALKQVVVEKLVDLYDKGGQGQDSQLAYDAQAKPNVYLFVGVNGAGKTTTIGKLAKRLKNSGKSVMMVAADTFRAGAVEQLVEWGKRDDVPVVTGKKKADPASVVYDGVSQAKEKGIDYLLVDTAGRLQNKVNLMNELDKIKRTIQKIIPDQPNEVLLVLDGSTGQNALLQAKDFDKTTKLTGLVLTKLDGSSKGGVVLAIRNEMDLPVKLVGLGEQVDDLADFDAEKFAIGLFQGLI